MPSNKDIGNFGEQIAIDFIRKNGYELVKTNYRYGKGEIDVICKDGSELVFVEVKYRKSLEYGRPESAITVSKQKQIRKIASAYLAENNIFEQDCRFDVIAILHFANQNPEIEHFKNAF